VQVRVDDIKDEGLALDFCESAQAFPALAEMQDEGECVFVEPICVGGRAQKASGLIEIEGEVRTAIRLRCSRCLAEFSTPLQVPFAVPFTGELPSIADGDEEGGGEVELTAEEMGLITYEGEYLELAEVIQEQVIMALPLQPLCRTDCRGLCPHCGADLNEGDCGCRPPVFNERFGALRDLKIDKKD